MNINVQDLPEALPAAAKQSMTAKYERLKNFLKELFQLDQPDLDFGLYRIMHAKRGEVTKFLEYDLLPQVKQAFSEYKPADKAEIEKELAKAIEQARSLGAEPETLPKVKELREKLATEAVDIDRLETEVYDHLFSFFRRYYSEGDFLAKRVYKRGVYAIPYEGEEVVLHWANRDQYYIKTSEYLRDYAFRLRPNDEQFPMRVHFRLSDVAEGEHGNVKAGENKDRVFILSNSNSGTGFICEEDGEQGKELVMRFEYRPAQIDDWADDERDGKTKPPTQKDLIALAVKRVLAMTDPAFVGWIKELGNPHVLSNAETAPYSRLEAHLKRYTARNTFDYFIHKDLGGFLRRELDFYIKNEVMYLDDVESESVPRVEQYLSKIKVVRKIGGKIIDFLAQLETFQEKLWLKKKFVVETRYLISLSLLPPELLPEIAANEHQCQEWKSFFDLSDDALADIHTLAQTHPTLLLDTRYFDSDTLHRLLNSIPDLDDSVGGILVHADNLQTLLLMRKKFQGKIECIHIDPPYNTQTSGFLYPNNYQHSSWLAMMQNLVLASEPLLTDSGSFLCHIDENEYERLHMLLEDQAIPDAGTIVWDKRNPMNAGRGIATQHEYVAWRSWRNTPLYLRNESILSILKAAEDCIAKCGGITEETRRCFSSWIDNNENLSGGEKAYRYLDDDGLVYQSVSLRAPEPRTDPKFHRPLLHPRTNLPCPVPPNGFSRTPETLQGMIERGEILFGPDEKTQPRQKVTLNKAKRRQISSVIQDAKKGKADLEPLGLDFPYCHPLSLYVRLLSAAWDSADAWICDYFAGSGTTGHAVIDINRTADLRGRFILADIAEHLETIAVPRIKKIVFSPAWKNGKPLRNITEQEASRTPKLLKVLRLESYEDSLNNLRMYRTETQQLMLDSCEQNGSANFKEEYLLNYMLKVEANGSQSLLNLQAFTDPTSYTLKVKRFGSDESWPTKVDLLETFNWLIGLNVRHITAPQTFKAEFERDTEKRLRLSPQRLVTDPKGPFYFRTVTGITPEGRNTLVIWRKLTGDPERDNLILDKWFTDEASKDTELDLIYVNGTNNLENLKASGDRWKVRLIEEDFHRLMFDVGTGGVAQ